MITIRPSRPEDAARALEIWRGAVLATHHFLSPEDFALIEGQVARDYLPHAPLWLAVDGQDRPLGFMGLTGQHLDSLFIAPESRGGGVGRALVAHALALGGGLGAALTVDVNEQNPQAIGFYERLGFLRTGWSATDDAGRPYPLIHMRLAG